LQTAGLVDIDVVDLTAEYRVTQQAKIDETERHREELIALVGLDEYEEGRRNRSTTLAGIDAGLLRRRLYMARRR
jgi:hypothetical protein